MRLIAHRGASAVWPEHTRAAYLQAIADGADGLECDVQLSADGVAVCWHDATVDRTSDGTGPVHAYTLAGLRELDVLRGRTPPPAMGSAAEQVLTLAELVDLAVRAERPLVLAIELKHPAPYGWAAEAAVLAVLESAGWRDGRLGANGEVEVSLMSFHPGSLAELARLGVPAPLLMQLLEEVDPASAEGIDPDLLDALDRLARLALANGAVGGVGPSVGLLRDHPEDHAAWQALGLRTRVWTVDTAAGLELCLASGVPEVTTNDPAGLRRLLG